MAAREPPTRRDERIIIHFDYDCFYASVFEAENPALRDLPFAVQQKQIIVTCNYEARRRGLHKLQLIRDARRICPEVIIELGEDISRFRDASKVLFDFLRSFAWSGRVERLGFDEVWIDVTDLVDWNFESINRNDLAHSFFQMSRSDPTLGFEFDASGVAGHAFPSNYRSEKDTMVDGLTLRLCLGSHLAMFIRHQLEEHKGYTSTVGISTNKMLSKLVGNVHKPKGQTTLMPPLTEGLHGGSSNVLVFLDDHEIGRIPGIGFKLAQRLREFVLQRPADFDAGLVYGGTKENVTVSTVRSHPEINPEKLETLLGGPGSSHGIGYKIWCLLHGVDDSEVSQVRLVPRQISIEDSYIRLDTLPEVLKELTALAKSLITRMRIDLLGDVDEDLDSNESGGEAKAAENGSTSKTWLAHPKTLRLTTRPRQPLRVDGTRVRSFKRISHSAPLPNLVFNQHESVVVLAERLVRDALISMFRRLHPERAGWNLSLVNLAVTNIAEAAGETRGANGRDIGVMFRRQEDVLKDFRVLEEEEEDQQSEEVVSTDLDHVQAHSEPDDEIEGDWIEEDNVQEDVDVCPLCHASVPPFAKTAHHRFHWPSSDSAV